MSIQLSQQDGLYYSTTDTFTVDTNPRSRYSPFVESALTELQQDIHHINNDDSSACSDESDEDVPLTEVDVALTGPAFVPSPSLYPPCVPVGPSHPLIPSLPPMGLRSRVSVRPTNLARQLESELWAAHFGHWGADQLNAPATHIDSLPNGFEFHIDWKEQARIRKRAARRIATKVNEIGVRFYMDFRFIRASSVNYRRPNINSDRIIDSYDGYSSYLLIVDDKLSKTWVFLTKSKAPTLDILRLFLCTFGRDRNLSSYIRCDQGGELARSHALIDMALTEFSYKVDPRLPTARPRMDRRKNGPTSLPSQHVPSSRGQHWNRYIGPRHSSMRSISTTAVSTPVPVSLLLKAGGVSNLILGTSNFLVHAFVISIQGIADPNWTNTISPDYSLGTHHQTKTFGTSISTAASQKHAIMPLLTRPGTCRTIAPPPHNSYTHLSSNRTLPSQQARPTALSLWHTTLHTLPWTQLYPTLPPSACVICLSIFPRPQISPARQSNQPDNLHTRALAS